MLNVSHIWIVMSSLTRQFLNLWLEYVLSQPVDMDLSVIFAFVKSYFNFSELQEHGTVEAISSGALTAEAVEVNNSLQSM